MRSRYSCDDRVTFTSNLQSGNQCAENYPFYTSSLCVAYTTHVLFLCTYSICRLYTSWKQCSVIYVYNLIVIDYYYYFFLLLSTSNTDVLAPPKSLIVDLHWPLGKNILVPCLVPCKRRQPFRHGVRVTRYSAIRILMTITVSSHFTAVHYSYTCTPEADTGPW